MDARKSEKPAKLNEHRRKMCAFSISLRQSSVAAAAVLLRYLAFVANDCAEPRVESQTGRRSRKQHICRAQFARASEWCAAQLQLQPVQLRCCRAILLILET